MRKLSLDILLEQVINLSKTRSLLYYETAIVALRKNKFQSGVKIKITGSIEEEVQLTWSIPVSIATINTYKDEQQLVNYGAIGITMVVLKNLFDFKVFEESPQGTGIDFWAVQGEVDINDAHIYDHNSRIEISGIFRANDKNTINARLSKKKKQIKASNRTSLPAWIVIVEFSSPAVKIYIK